MRITKYISLLFIGLIPFSAFAATTVSFSPLTGEYREGQIFSVNIAVNPQNPVYTVKAELTYPANLLEVQSFTFANNWMPLSQTGYDLVDNKNGLLVKTAGYPGGLSSQTVFGTAIFKVKTKGSATVKLGDGSLALDGNNVNTINNFSSQATFTLIEKVVSAVPTPAPQPKITTKSVASQTEPKPQVSSGGELAKAEQEPQTAAVITAAEAKNYGLWLMIFVALSSLAAGFLLGRNTNLVTSLIKRKR